ncbi:MAG TPA: ABC transporter permease [Gemmatales bacterium]|nr:ABC transporter permease [Gemmatales bacterium]
MSTMPAPLDRTIPLGAIWTSFTLTLRGLLQWKRLTLLIFLSIVPLIGVIVFRTVAVPRLESSQVLHNYLNFEFFGVLAYFSSVVAPLTILLLATGMIRDEQENQTLTYLLMCPIPRWALYLSKLLAAIFVGWLITIVCMGLVMMCLWTGNTQAAPTSWITRWLALMPAMTLLIAANAGLFGLISVLLRPSLIIGVVYIALFEGFLANFRFVLRKFTSVHYFQCIVVNWIGKDYEAGKFSSNAIEWAIVKDREVVPETQECVIILLSIFLVSTLLAMYFFTTREFRMKTPEGN